MNIDLTLLPAYMQKTLKCHHNMIEWIWDGWCADVRGIGKLKEFVASTLRTYRERDRKVAAKTAHLITQYLLAYFCMEGVSDMKKVSTGYYGWPKTGDK